MKTPYLVARKSGRKKYYHFRSFIPKDLIQKFHGRKEFQISLKNVTNEKKQRNDHILEKFATRKNGYSRKLRVCNVF